MLSPDGFRPKKMSISLQRRILVSAKYFSENYGGTPESVLLLARIFAAINVDIDVISPAGLFRSIRALTSLPKAGASGEPSAFMDIASYDGVFVAGPWNAQALSVAFRAYRAGVPISYAPKGGLSWADFMHFRDFKKIPYLILIEIFLICAAQRVIFSSSAERDNCILPSCFWRHKQALLPEPFLPDAPSTAAKPTPSAGPVIGFLAEIRPLKGLRELVEAVGLIAADPCLASLTLRVAGVSRPGYERYVSGIHALVDRLGISARIEWLGGVRGHENRSAFYDGLDLFVCPSKSESFGLTPLEALWHGVPVIMSSNIGVSSYMPADIPVLQFGPVEPDEIAKALRQAFSRQQELREKATKWRGRLLPGLAGNTLAAKFFKTLTLQQINGNDQMDASV